MIRHFRVERLLGTGGMSVVYECTDLGVNRRVAVKVMQQRFAAEEKWLMRFRQEAVAVGRLSHPNIVRVHHFDSQSDEPFIVMDYVDGSSLSDILSFNGPLSIERAIRMIASVMDALAHAHANGVVHRDLKPSNIMVVDPHTAHESIRILDFGIAKIEEEMNYKLTQTGEIFGSPLYMSPEQCMGKQASDRSDQYSIGCLLFECLTGHPPFLGDSSMSIMLQHMNDAPAALREASLGKDFPDALESVVQQLLEKEPEKRYASMAEAKQALEKAASACSMGKSFQKTIFPSDNNQKRRIAAWVGTVLGGIALTAGVTYYFFSMLAPGDQLGPQVKQELIIPSIDEDYGDRAIKEYLAVDDHNLARSFDSGAHGFKVMTDKGLAAISKMPNLSSLTLTNCGNITAEGLKNLWNVPKLAHLDMKGTSIGDNSLDVIVQIKPLLDLTLNRTDVHQRGLEMLAKTRLHALSVCTINLDEDGCKAISAIKSLQGIKTSNNHRIGEGVAYLAKLPRLDYLDLENTNLDDDQIQSLSGAMRLRTLILGRTHITDTGMRSLSHLKNLERLFLNSTYISDQSLDSLSSLKSLSYLNLHHCKISKAALEKFRKNMPDCYVDLATPDKESVPGIERD